MNTDWVLGASEPSVVVRAFERRFGGSLKVLEKAVLGAATGSEDAAHEYVAAWHDLAEAVLKLVWKRRPELEPFGEVLREAVIAVAPAAPFSRWVSHEGLSRGIGLRLLCEIRITVPDAAQLRVPRRGQWRPWAEVRAMHTAWQLIEVALIERTARTHDTPLSRVMQLFGLDRTEIARLFGVTRQAVEQWEQRGVPPERQAKLSTIQAIGELLARKLRPGTLPGVARTRAEAYRGETMLDMIVKHRHEALLEDVRASFDWAATA
jgi:DNA-binding transcriptional regulator YiaG